MNRIREYFKDNKIELLLLFLYLILPIIFFKDIDKLNSVIMGKGDAEMYSVPFQQLLTDSIKNLDPVLWNNYTFSGFPLLSQFGFLYPVSALLGLIFPTLLAYNISVLLHYSIAGIFLYLFLKEYKLSRIACFTGGLVFMFSGAMVTHRDLTQSIYTFVWIPLILLFLEKFRKSRHYEFVLIASVFYSISFLGSHQQIFFYGSMVIFFYIIFYSLIYKGVREYFFLSSLSIFVISAFMVSFVMIPGYEAMSNSTRDAISYTFFSDFSFDPKLLPVLIFPFIYGSGTQSLSGVPKYFGPWNSGEMLIYFGVSTIILLALGFFVKNRHKYLWIFILAFSFLLVLGRHTPFYRLMYFVPLYNKFRVPARNWFEFGLAFSILSGFGLDYLVRNFNSKIKRIILGVTIFLGCILAGFISFYLIFKSRFGSFLTGVIELESEDMERLLQNIDLTNYSIYAPLLLIITSLGLLILLLYKRNKITYTLLVLVIFIDLFSMGHFLDENRDASYVYDKIEDSGELSFLKNEDEQFRIYPLSRRISGFRLYPNMNFYYEIEIISGYGPLVLKDYKYITGLENDPGWGTDWKKLLANNDIVSFLNTKYIILQRPEDPPGTLDRIGTKNYSIVFDNGKEIILENKNYLPRFYLVDQIVEAGDLQEARDIIWEEDGKDFDPGTSAIVEDPDFEKRRFSNEDTVLAISEYNGQKAILETESSSDAFLVFSDSYYPGWNAFIDNKQVKVYRVNGIIKGIYIPEGSHHIIFSYYPTYFFASLIISLAALLLSIGVIVFLFIRRRKKFFIGRKKTIDHKEYCKT